MRAGASVAQFLRFGLGQFAQQVLGPGDQVDCYESELQPGLVDREDAGGEAPESGVFTAADAVLDAGMGAVTGFQELDGAAAGWGVGGET
jgi:hypothetical protein